MGHPGQIFLAGCRNPQCLQKKEKPVDKASTGFLAGATRIELVTRGFGGTYSTSDNALFYAFSILYFSV